MDPLFDVSREIVLVTGASQGLGRQFARVLAERGAGIVLAARQIDKLKSLEQEIKDKGGRAVAVPLDVTDLASMATAIDRGEAALGPVTVLINNAGIAVEKLAVEQSEADWDAVIGANLKGAYFLATEVARRMIARQQGGNIVNIASVLGDSVMKFLSPYAVSKAGIIQATKALALELASARIRVNALAPGYIDTDINHAFWSTPGGEKLIKGIPQRRVGHESDLDGAILLLASNASRYMTGSVVTVDGGFLLA
ncbi:SDR family NAD(P)-dependent oxidoreductase [Rhodopseudomonas pseudopalustris]|uniref:3-oxoacyl-[acyl-carrier protein] reductase n=1 Tax=Rhodopseudomonas pseudopalustris TaxID=1513892 RepID=A0A1H8PEK0_9BRAD|nr:SDR family NAD(P)-dependent oxidoreductase [Rhodopseudomonas pseudopalustris]MBB1092536.1 SDR family oxidoreductase [Rhodopseudomonas palustris]SEO39973.1 3-oxoacyl-[acyl-carrier protein] reductase [Rhodopseudomonas pseudopalustris]